ncbi:hypothetical protein [Prescottella agglutinans]|uniref:Transmembrane protein n=1 Tax=Prescottella agglutinans TaxID=1644129 RepID=A0ABT6M7I8_9NOCA|nr:hypothetical protein [Prescottella agglutinans]MDH6280272.1 hypothetical protein [Prescottella agglutinans]
METHFGGLSPDAATDALNSLSADRERLGARIEVPSTLLVAFGGLAAWWVATAAFASPGEGYEPASSAWLPIGLLAVAYVVRRRTGIRFRSMGADAAWALVGIAVSCLLLFSVSLGLVSFGMRWAVVPTSVAAFAVTTVLARVAYRSAIEKVRRG